MNNKNIATAEAFQPLGITHSSIQPPQCSEDRLHYALDRLHNLVFSTLNLDNIMSRVIIEAARDLGADSAFIGSMEKGSLVLRYLYNLPEELKGVCFPADRNRITAAMMSTLAPRLLQDLAYSEEIDSSFCEHYGIASMMIVPVVRNNEIIGALFFNSGSSSPPFGDDSALHFAKRLAAYLALAIDNAHLYDMEVRARQQAKSELEISSHLLQTANSLASSLDLHQLFSSLLDIIAETSGGDNIAIGLLCRKKSKLEIVACRGISTVKTGEMYAIDELSLDLHRCISEKRAVTATSSSFTVCELVLKGEYQPHQTVYHVPLILHDEVIGLISVGIFEGEISDRQRRLIEVIASQASIAIENAELYDERRNAEELLWSVNERLSSVLGSITDGFLSIGFEGRLLQMNHVTESVLGRLEHELKDRILWDEVPEVRDSDIRLYCEAAKAEGIQKHFEGQAFGACRWTEMHVYPRTDHLDIYFRDISERKEAEEQLLQMTERLTTILESISDAFFSLDRNWQFQYVNGEAERILGRNRQELVGKNFREVFPQTIGSTFIREYHRAITEQKTIEFVSFYEPLNLWAEVRAYPSREGISVYFRDVTGRIRMEEAIRYQAYHDVLTGLSNKASYMDRLNQEISRSHRHGQRLAIMFLDLDRFKNVNDSFSHSVGDELLQQVARRIKSCVRESDTVARIGGDEFTILVSDVADNGDAALVAEKILAAFRAPFLLSGQQMIISTSIGISIYPYDGEVAESLIKHADIAMYHAKGEGRNNYQFYNPTMNIRTLERIILENSLRQTLDRGELEVHYQPQVDLTTRQIVSAEALVRWRHPDLGVLQPVQFIPLAEETGFIVPIDEWVLRTACSQNKAWQEAGYPPLAVTVNMSARQFHQQDVAEMVAQVLDETGLDPEYLEIEITEGVAMRDIENTIPSLQKLTDLGVRFSIDDFGTGYSSLSHLKKLPIQKLKIDRSFISDIGADPEGRAIVKAVIAMAHNLKLQVIAEGVENGEQLKFLISASCDGIQGYLASKPVPALEFQALLGAA